MNKVQEITLGGGGYIRNLPAVTESKLKYSTRKHMKGKSFALSNERKYPIHDVSHARNALSRVSANGTPSEKKRVRAAVHKKYPSLKKD